MSGCQFWHEVEGEGSTYEYCKADNKNCTCAGIKEECKNGLYDDQNHDIDPDEDDGCILDDSKQA